MMNGRPISNRKKVQLLVALTILAWATQTLLHQWARGQEIPESTPSEKFVPAAARPAGATLELRTESTVRGGEIKLRQICRWSNADAKFFAPLADLTISRFQGDGAFYSVSLDEIRQTLHDAGVNLGIIRFAGSASCTVTRGDATPDQSTALQQWAAAKEGKNPPAAPIEASLPTTQKSANPKLLNASPVKTLRDLITADASIRLNVPVDQLQINFNPADDKLLNLSEPQFKFNLEARRVFNLGDVSWEVTIVTDTASKKVPISAVARAWQNQVVLVRPVAFRQVIQPEDLSEKRILTDRTADEPLLTMSQCVGQETSRELKPGTVLTSRMVSPVDLAKPGQFVTVTLSNGNIRVKTVGCAMEAGSYGQTIKVKNEATGEKYEVVLTGPQEGTVSPLASNK